MVRLRLSTLILLVLVGQAAVIFLLGIRFAEEHTRDAAKGAPGGADEPLSSSAGHADTLILARNADAPIENEDVDEDEEDEDGVVTTPTPGRPFRVPPDGELADEPTVA
ncbi:hypothetical protein KFE25_012147 [Diacronema lutheri]|uniref:Uncharacterized protein n=1 Tax=Diacronema lutheri TaxID=2081491 RepID=A0A8J5XEJ4_DIALT|nr:hypothetical protein KFE25_012147 [Diacronema lutheri]